MNMWGVLLIAISANSPHDVVAQFDTVAHCEVVRKIMHEKRPMFLWVCAEGMRPMPGK